MITVTKYDRLARSLRDLLDIVDTIQAHGAGFRSLAEDIDTTTPAGRLVFHVFASIAPVSYTHLDVYKRQVDARAGLLL